MDANIRRLTEEFRVAGLELAKAERMRAKGETLNRLERVVAARGRMERARRYLREAILEQMPEMQN